MIVGAENIKSWLKFNDCRFWRISKGEKSNLVFEFWDDDKNSNATVNDALTAIDEAFGLLHSGTYFIVATGDTKNQRNWKQTYFEHKGNSSAEVAGIGKTPTLSTENIDDLINDRVKKILEERDKEARIKELETELAEYRQKDTSRTDALISSIGMLKPYIEPLMSGIVSKLGGNIGQAPQQQKQIIQMKHAANEVQAPADAQKRLTKIISDMQDIEPTDWMDLLEAIVKLKIENPAMYDMARNILLPK